MIRNALLGSVAAIAISGSAFAADLPTKKAPLAYAPPVFTWTGFYVGATAGGIGSNSKGAFSDPVSDAYYGNLNGNSVGFIGGLTAGYNYQINSIVVGLEADYSFASAHKDINSVSTGGYSLIGTSKLDSFGTVRARLGYAFDRTLLYVTGGLAVAGLKGTSNFYEPDNSKCTAGFSKTKTGWTLGGGIEYALTNNVSVKLEGLYADFGKKSASSYCGCQTSFKNTATVVRGGVNYKF